MRAKVLVKTDEFTASEYDVCEMFAHPFNPDKTVISYQGSKDRTYGKGPWVGGDIEQREDIVNNSDIVSARRLD